MTNLLANLENSWLGITDLSVNKNELNKYKEFRYMKEFVRNLTDFSLYLKKRPEEDKVPIAEILVKKLNNMMIEKRQKAMRADGGCDFLGVQIPFEIGSDAEESMVVS